MPTSLFGDIIFGPIRSRRLGLSLGVNLLPVNGKICSFNCIYCECGYNGYGKGVGFPKRSEVAKALEAKLKQMKAEDSAPDVITFAGNGEPTLHPDFAAIIDDTLHLRDLYFPNAKVSVLSNSTMIDRPDVFDALNKVDNNILKLDSAFLETIQLIDAPVSSSFTVDKLVDNLKKFKGNLVIQTMFLRGKHGEKVVDNTTPAEIEAWLKLIQKIAPKLVMIYSIDRPTPEKELIKVPKEELEKIGERVKALGIAVSVA